MFPLQRSGELCFKIYSNPNHSDPKILQDLLKITDNNNNGLAGSGPDPLAQKVQVYSADNKGDKKMIGSKRLATSNEEESGSECSRKKRHREIEKQRRQEMASLFAGLRSLLPLEFIRGKRSISDQMNEAVNYIRHLQSNMKDLEAKRSALKRSSNLKCVDEIKSSSSDSAVNRVTVHPWFSGTQILIRGGLRVFPLSVVMELLSQQGLNIVSCLSSQVNNKTFDKIYCEASEESSPMNLIELRNKIEEVISYSF